MRANTPFGPVWLIPDMLPERVAKQEARLELLWPDLDGFIAMHTGPPKGGAWLVRAPIKALEAAGLPTGSAAEHPVAEGTVWPPIDKEIQNWIVEYTPGPPAIGVLTTTVVEAESADQAHQIIKDRHRWVMIHKVRKEVT